MDDDGDGSYVIRTGVDALDRLHLLARTFWPTTRELFSRTGAFDATRAVDVGCGIGDLACRLADGGVDEVLGIDINADVIAAASDAARHRNSSATFRNAAIDDLGSEPALDGFDLVVARCLVSHQADPVGDIRAMLGALRPGGTILIEDVEVGAVWASPPCAALTRHVELYVAAAEGLDAHPDVGASIAPMLAEAGAVEIGVDIVQPVLRNPADLQIHARTMEAIAAPVVAQGLATESEIVELVAELDRWAERPAVVATLPRIVQVDARAPSGA